MANYIRATAVHSISAGKLEEFKKVASDLIERVDAGEPGTLSYEWFLSHDESKCYVVQIYEDSEAVMAHLKNIADLIEPTHAIAPLTELMVFGNPSDALRQALEPVGAMFLNIGTASRGRPKTDLAVETRNPQDSPFSCSLKKSRLRS